MVAEVLGVPEATVILHDRNLSLAGLRSMGGRGRAVARVTYTDAANLLIAVAGSRNVKDSAKTVEAYASLATTFRPALARTGQPIPFDTFRDALAFLVQEITENAALYTLRTPAPESYLRHDSGYVEVTLQGPVPGALIDAGLSGNTISIGYGEYRIEEYEYKKYQAGLRYAAIFDHLTLAPVGQLVASD